MGKRLHVEQRAALVVRVGEHEQRNIIAECVSDPSAIDQSSLSQALRFQTLNHVDIGREITWFAQDDLAFRSHLQRGGN